MYSRYGVKNYSPFVFNALDKFDNLPRGKASNIRVRCRGLRKLLV
jgi:hypothetical protein